MRLRCDGMFNGILIANFLLSVAVKEFLLKFHELLVNIMRKSFPLFGPVKMDADALQNECRSYYSTVG